MWGLVDSFKCEECLGLTSFSARYNQSRPELAKKISREPSTRGFTPSSSNQTTQSLETKVQTLRLSWQRTPVGQLNWYWGQRRGVENGRSAWPALKPFTESGKIPLHPTLVQADGLQRFPHASQLRAVLPQAGEEPLHLNNTHTHTNKQQSIRQHPLNFYSWIQIYTWLKCDSAENWEVTELMIDWKENEPMGNLQAKTPIRFGFVLKKKRSS